MFALKARCKRAGELNCYPVDEINRPSSDYNTSSGVGICHLGDGAVEFDRTFLATRPRMGPTLRPAAAFPVIGLNYFFMDRKHVGSPLVRG